MKNCLNGAKVPPGWAEALILISHKEGNKEECGNYRGLSVTSAFSCFCGKIMKKVEEEYTDLQAEKQASFHAGRLSIDYLHTLTQVIEKNKAAVINNLEGGG